eukprot:11626217-Alexandrium_andersonii.AAC.1
MYRAIEKGASWPRAMVQGRTAILAKAEANCEDAMQYRLLTLLSAAYRLWAKVRVADVAGWAA